MRVANRPRNPQKLSIPKNNSTHDALQKNIISLSTKATKLFNRVPQLSLVAAIITLSVQQLLPGSFSDRVRRMRIKRLIFAF